MRHSYTNQELRAIKALLTHASRACLSTSDAAGKHLAGNLKELVRYAANDPSFLDVLEETVQAAAYDLYMDTRFPDVDQDDPWRDLAFSGANYATTLFERDHFGRHGKARREFITNVRGTVR